MAKKSRYDQELDGIITEVEDAKRKAQLDEKIELAEKTLAEGDEKGPAAAPAAAPAATKALPPAAAPAEAKPATPTKPKSD